MKEIPICSPLPDEIEKYWQIYNEGKEAYYQAHRDAEMGSFSSEDDRRAAAWGAYQAVLQERERLNRPMRDDYDIVKLFHVTIDAYWLENNLDPNGMDRDTYQTHRVKANAFAALALVRAERERCAKIVQAEVLSYTEGEIVAAKIRGEVG